MIGIDTPLLYILVVRFIELFSFRSSVYLYVLPYQQLVLWLLPLALLAVYLLIDFRRPKYATNLKLAVIATLGIFLVTSLIGMQIVARHVSDPVVYVHDGAVQAEDAVDALRAGENPYAIDYRTRTFGAFPDVFSQATRPNPAWSHFIYLPLPVLLGIPTQWVAEQTIGWFDIRMLYTLAFALLVFAGTLLVRDHNRRPVVLMLLLFSPMFTQYVAAGFNDVLFLSLIALAALGMVRGWWMMSGIAIGLAAVTKQTAWLFVPFYLVHAWLSLGRSVRNVWQQIWPGVIFAAVILGIFFAWSPFDFVDDTIRYASGSATESYPISGFGLGQLLLSSGVISSMWDAYPFWTIQLAVGLPLVWWLIRWQRSDPSPARALLAYAIFALVFWFTSRYFNDSYLGVVSVILVLAYAARDQRKQTE